MPGRPFYMPKWQKKGDMPTDMSPFPVTVQKIVRSDTLPVSYQAVSSLIVKSSVLTPPVSGMFRYRTVPSDDSYM